MKNSRNTIMLIVCLVLGGYFFVKGMGVVVQDFQTGIKYNTMTVDQIKEGTLVEGDIVLVIDCFEEETLRRNASEITTSRLYFIPIPGENKCIGLKVDGTRCDKMDNLLEDTWEYYENQNKEPTDYFQIKGKIVPYSDQELRFAYEYMREFLSVSTDAECDPYFVPYYIDSCYYGRAYIPLLIAAFFGLAAFGWYRRGKKEKKVTYTSYEDTSYDDMYSSSLPEQPKESVMRENPFDVARRELEMEKENNTEDTEETESQENSGIEERATTTSLRLKL